MNILLVDDHALFRDLLEHYFARHLPDVNLVLASDFAAGMAAARQIDDLALVLLDFHMPGMHGLSGLCTMQRLVGDVPVALISGVANTSVLKAALDAGAQGVIPKSLDGAAAVAAVQTILDGERFVPANLLADLDVGAAAPTETPADNPIATLTRRETQVLSLLTLGLANKQIAYELNIQEVTVKLYVGRLLRKFQVQNRTQAVTKAIDLGWQN